MLTDGVSAAIGAGATVNLFAGRPIEFLGQPSNVTLLANGDAAGLTGQVLINVGGNQSAPVAAGTPLNTAAAAGQGPKNDEDVLATFAVPSGARLQFNVTATGATTARYRAIITP